MWCGARSSSKLSFFSKLYQRNFSSEIFVSRLSHYTTEEELKNTFLRFGKIKEVRLARDEKTQRLKGFGFVRFESDTAAEKAIKGMDKRIIQGRLIFVEKAKSKPELVAEGRIHHLPKIGEVKYIRTGQSK